jgi:FtsP/CotA-like multicopper oxidase with cupredoxin domain
MEIGISQPRRRSSATSDVNMHPAQDEVVKLLRDEDNGLDEPRDGKRRSAIGNETSSRLRLLGWAFATFFLITILLKSSSVLYNSSALPSPFEVAEDAIDDYLPEPMLGIRLHPEEHHSRPATTITHYWNITSGYRSPDGVRKLVYLINEEFPGPTIECRSGDRLVIHVTNSLESEGVSIHWHGLEMRGTNAMDGAVGFTQCPTSPGTFFTYDFTVGEDQAGTFWWHAHSQVQRGDGMFGGLVVHKPIAIDDEKKTYDYEHDVLVMVGDWYHRNAGEVLAWYTSTRGFGNEVRELEPICNLANKFSLFPIHYSSTEQENSFVQWLCLHGLLSVSR